jgi:hypothetical protein
MIRLFPSFFRRALDGDAYAAGGGFRSGQALSAITFHREGGEIGRHRVNIIPGRPRVWVRAA